ncbi:MAG TPA: hypothetical protein VEG84_04865, partial [Thermoanaerobaculia bacterium]|nr:hypothetical protein [Thermoanaerobaculia bacterium]
MKKTTLLVVALLAGLAGTSAAQQAQSGAAQPGASAGAGTDLEKYRMAISEERRKLFGSAMSYLSAAQLQAFWAVYGDFEKEQD